MDNADPSHARQRLPQAENLLRDGKQVVELKIDHFSVCEHAQQFLMTAKVALQHRLKFRVTASTFHMLSQSISNDVAHGGFLNLRDAPHFSARFSSMRNVMLLVFLCGAIWSSCGGVLITRIRLGEKARYLDIQPLGAHPNRVEMRATGSRAGS